MIFKKQLQDVYKLSFDFVKVGRLGVICVCQCIPGTLFMQTMWWNRCIDYMTTAKHVTELNVHDVECRREGCHCDMEFAEIVVS